MSNRYGFGQGQAGEMSQARAQAIGKRQRQKNKEEREKQKNEADLKLLSDPFADHGGGITVHDGEYYVYEMSSRSFYSRFFFRNFFLMIQHDGL